MKIFNKIAVLMAAAVAITSCESDDSAANENLIAAPQTAAVVLEKTTDAPFVLENGGTANLLASISSPLPYDLRLSIGFESSDGAINSNNIVEFSITNDNNIVIPAGSTEAPVVVTFVDDQLADAFETYTFTLNNAASTAEYDVNYTIVNTSDPIEVAVVDAEPVSVVTTPGAAQLDLNFDPAGDLDCIIARDFTQTAGFTTAQVVDFSFGTTTPEITFFPTAEPDSDTYGYWIDDFLNAYPADYELVITFPNGEEATFTGSITAENDRTSILRIIKSTLESGDTEFLFFPL